MVKAINEMAETLSFPASQICYVMTDFTESNFNFWTTHPRLAEYVKSGQLGEQLRSRPYETHTHTHTTSPPFLFPPLSASSADFAIFDAVNDSSLTLHFSKAKLSADSKTKNPIVVVANYLFDTLCHDAFQVSDGELKEGLVSVGSTRPSEPDPLDPEIIKNFSNLYKYEPIETTYYDTEADGADGTHLARILEWYKDHFTKVREGARGAK